MNKLLLVPLLACAACGGSTTDSVTGRLVRRDGTPVSGARVTIGDGQATSGADGRFSLALAPSRAALARVLVPGEREHAVPVAVLDGEARVVIPSPAPPGTADLWLAGDVMFSRRYVDPNGDGDDGDALVSLDDPQAGAAAVLQYVAPLMRDADLSVINLETAVTDAGMIHPRKPYTLRSEPAILGALAASGVGVVSLANNHVFDYTEEGLNRMLDLIDAAKLPRVGAGRSWDDAVTPRVMTVNGVKVALIAATSITGRPYSLDSGGDETEGDNLPPYYTAEVDRAGALRLDEDTMVESIRRADAAGADVKILIMHGGTQYSRAESPYLRRMAYKAIDHGVSLVVGHHPHVAQGIEVYKGVPIVYSVGNLAFDQQFPETFPALVVEARVTRGAATEVAVRPIYLDGFTPRAMAGEDAVRVLRDIAGRSAALGATLVIDRAAARATIQAGSMPAETTTEMSAALLPGSGLRTLPQRISESDGMFLTGVDAAPGLRIDLGRSLLVDADFVDGNADDGEDVPGWTIVGREKRIIRTAGAAPELRLLRGAVSAEDSTARSTGRVTVTPGKRLSLVGRWRRDAGAGRAAARILLYGDRETGSVPAAVAEARGAGTEWAQFSVDLLVPEGARYAQVQLAHLPPTADDRGEVAFSSVELLEWAGGVPPGNVTASSASYVAIESLDGSDARATLRLAPTPRPAIGGAP